MRVHNDREEQQTGPSEIGVVPVLVHAFFAAMGIASVFLTPLPMLVAGLRLEEPWPKVSAILGAVLAILFFEVSPAVVTVAFVFGLFVEDGVRRKIPFWQMVARAALLAVVLGAAALIFLATWSRTGVWEAWSNQVTLTVTQIQSIVQGDSTAPVFPELASMLLYEGPFLLVSGALISLWLSVGLVSHIGLLETNSAYSSSALRALRLPSWLSGLFLGLFALMVLLTPPWQQFASGLYRLGATIFFIQGTICLAQLLDARKLSHRARTFAYVFGVLLGFYVLVGLGVLSPWILRKKEIKAIEA